jgi:hypothetical protein
VRSRPGFLRAVLAQPRVKRLLSSEHFSVEGTLIEARASMKSFGPKKPPDTGGAAGGGITPAMAAGVTTKAVVADRHGAGGRRMGSEPRNPNWQIGSSASSQPKA